MKLIVFDCDGTLVDSQHLIVAAMAQAFADQGLPPLPRADVLSIVGLSLPLAVARLLPLASETAVLAVAEAYRAAFHRLRQDPTNHEPMFPGALETLMAMTRREDLLLGMATGKSRRGVAAILERFGLVSHFVTVQTADTHPSKPDPSMLLKAMAETGVRPADTIMIGDTTFDMEMARAAGAGAIGVAWGYHPVVALEKAGAHVIVDRCEDLISAAGLDADVAGARA